LLVAIPILALVQSKKSANLVLFSIFYQADELLPSLLTCIPADITSPFLPVSAPIEESLSYRLDVRSERPNSTPY
jgi:hypothetical protein